jgi:phage replication-related protein YjqB (UPF0714/DUF867 family)
LDLVKQAKITVSIHCAKGDVPYTYVGGRGAALMNRIRTALANNGFEVKIPPERLSGNHPQNIVNRNKRGWGQLELSGPQLDVFFTGEQYIL